MLYGFDVSHWNGRNGIKDGIRNCPSNPDFCFIKATEGKTYKDKLCTDFVVEAVDKNLRVGLYHYARPEKNTVAVEVNNFMSVYSRYNDELNIIPILDWEGMALNCSELWAIDWLTNIYELTGIKPIFYCQQSALKNYAGISKLNYPLWVARYRKFELGVGNIEPFDTCDFWQYTSTPMDFSVFYGTLEDLIDMGIQKTDTNKEDEMECQCHHCGCQCHHCGCCCHDKE